MQSTFMGADGGGNGNALNEVDMSTEMEQDTVKVVVTDNEMVVVDDEPTEESQNMLRSYLLQNRPVGDQSMGGLPNETEVGIRKLTKPMIEKRRRERMNRCLDYLKQMVIDSKQDVPFLNINKTRLEKADILEITVQYIIGKQYEEYRQQLTGFDLCFNELSKFILESRETDDNLPSSLRNRLSLQEANNLATPNELLALFKHLCVMRDQLSYECELQRQHAASLVSSLMKKEMTSKLRSNSMSDGELSSPTACNTPTNSTSKAGQLPDSEKEFLGKLYKLYQDTEVPKSTVDCKLPHTGVIRHTNETRQHLSVEMRRPMDLSSSASSVCSSSSKSSISSNSSVYSSSSTTIEPSIIRLEDGSSLAATKSPFFTEPKNGFWPRFSYDSYASSSGNERNSCYETLWKPYEP